MSSNIRKIALDELDDPKIAIRSNLDDPDLDELMISMKDLGLLEPIVVRPVANRYEVIAGHRRSRAARLLNWGFIEAKIIEANEEEVFAMRLAENLQRKDNNPVDEACFVGEIILKYKKTPEQMATLLRRSDKWISERLEVFDFPEYMKDHLRLQKYPLGAALWINRLKSDNTKRYYAMWANINGCTIAQAHRWFENLKKSDFILPDSGEIEVGTDEGDTIKRTIIKCSRCGKDLFLDEAETAFIHKICPSN